MYGQHDALVILEPLCSLLMMISQALARSQLQDLSYDLRDHQIHRLHSSMRCEAGTLLHRLPASWAVFQISIRTPLLMKSSMLPLRPTVGSDSNDSESHQFASAPSSQRRSGLIRWPSSSQTLPD